MATQSKTKGPSKQELMQLLAQVEEAYQKDDPVMHRATARRAIELGDLSGRFSCSSPHFGWSAMCRNSSSHWPSGQPGRLNVAEDSESPS